jgi:Na+/melibiose symporter-like transporter
VFIIQAILSVPVFFMALYLLDGKVVDGSRRRSSGKFDYLGTLFSAAAFAVLLFSINTGIRIFNGITIALCFLSVAALFISFFYVESRSENPILDLSLIRNKDFVLSISTRLFGFFAGSSLFFLMPFYIQLIKGRTPEEAGFLIFPGALGMSLTASVSGRLSDRFGQKPFIISGLSVILVASYLFSRFTPSTPNIIIVATLIFHGLGMGLWGSPNGSQTVSLVPRHLYGSVSSIINLIRTVGMGVSIAVASSIVTISFVSSGIEPNFSQG